VKLNYTTLAIVSVAIVALLRHFWGPPWTAMRIAGLVVSIPCCVLLAIARIQLGRAFSVRAKATTLVTTGIYSRIRNPIYLFGSPAIMGLALFANRPWLLLAFVIIIPMQIQRARNEERVLTEKFGAAYLAWKQQTWF
jgi:protein-S-isoprenylcysteine O-methyltransferase Ste14